MGDFVNKCGVKITNFGDFYVNRLLPHDAKALRYLYTNTGKNSQKEDLLSLPLSVLSSRLITAPLTIPIALVTSASYGVRGLLRSSVKVLDLNFAQAIKLFAQDSRSAVICLAIAIMNVAYTALGLLCGSLLFAKFIPKPLISSLSKAEVELISTQSKANYESKIKKSNDKIKKLKEGLKNNKQDKTEIDKLNQQLKEQEIAKQNIEKNYRKATMINQINYVNSTQQLKEDLEASYQIIDERNRLDMAATMQAIFQSPAQINMNSTLMNRSMSFQAIDLNSSITNLQIAGKADDFKIVNTEQENNNYPVEIVPQTERGGTIWGIAAAIVSAAQSVAQSVAQTVYSVFVDGYDTWKEHRYTTAFDKIKQYSSLAELKTIQHQLEEYQNKNTELVVENLKLVIEALENPTKNKSGEQYHDFQTKMRTLLELVYQNFLTNLDIGGLKELNTIEEGLKKALTVLLEAWYESIIMMPFNFKLVLYVASKGNAHIKEALQFDGQVAKNPSLSAKFYLLYEGLKTADATYKAPQLHLVAGRAGDLLQCYDAMADTNIPSQWAMMEYKNNQSGEIKKSIHVRTPVQVMPSYETTLLKAWEIEEPLGGRIRVNPEYLAFLRGKIAKGEKVLNILHLDPLLYASSTNSSKQASLMQNLQIIHTRAKTREALWIQLMVKLSQAEEFKEHFQVALLPMDGEWLAELTQETKKIEDLSVDEFSKQLEALIMQEDSPFILPGVKDKGSFAQELCKKVQQEYFKEMETLTQVQRLAFYGLFCSKAAEALQFITQASTITRNCKQGIDRTMGLVGAELCEKTSRLGRGENNHILGQLEDLKTQDQIIALTLSAALANHKREPLKERMRIVEATMTHLEWLKQHANHLGAPSLIEGYQLTKVTIAEDASQSLYPAPATVIISDKANENYIKLLNFDKENPLFLPSHLPLKELASVEQTKKGKEKKEEEEISIEALKEAALKILQNRYDHALLKYKTQLTDQLLQTSNENTDTLEYAFEILKENEIMITGVLTIITDKKKDPVPHLSWKLNP